VNLDVYGNLEAFPLSKTPLKRVFHQARGKAQAVDCLLYKHEALMSNTNTATKKKVSINWEWWHTGNPNT
jgi:hypothetical protein